MAFKDDVAFINKTTQRKILQFNIINISLLCILGACSLLCIYVSSVVLFIIMGAIMLWFITLAFGYVSNRKKYTKLDYEGIDNLYLDSGVNSTSSSFQVGHIMFLSELLSSVNVNRVDVINGQFNKEKFNQHISKYADKLRLESTEKIKVK